MQIDPHMVVIRIISCDDIILTINAWPLWYMYFEKQKLLMNNFKKPRLLLFHTGYASLGLSLFSEIYIIYCVC